MQTQIRLLQEEQSDQGLHCLLIPFASFFLTKYPRVWPLYLNFRFTEFFLASKNLGTLQLVRSIHTYLRSFTFLHLRHRVVVIFLFTSSWNNKSWEHLCLIMFNYRNGPKFWDRSVWANSADPDQTASRGAV